MKCSYELPRLVAQKVQKIRHIELETVANRLYWFILVSFNKTVSHTNCTKPEDGYEYRREGKYTVLGRYKHTQPSVAERTGYPLNVAYHCIKYRGGTKFVITIRSGYCISFEMISPHQDTHVDMMFHACLHVCCNQQAIKNRSSFNGNVAFSTR
jgi:hypothetical protein